MGSVNLEAVRDPEKILRRVATAGRAAAATKVYEEFEEISVLSGNVAVTKFERPTGWIVIEDVQTGVERRFQEVHPPKTAEATPVGAKSDHALGA